MKTQTVAQKSFAQAVEKFINQLPWDDSLCVLCVCQTLHPTFEEACNPFFVFPVSQRVQALPVIMEWAKAFEAVNWMLPALTESFHYELYSEEEFNSALENQGNDAFLNAATSAMKLQMNGIENPYLVVSPQGSIPKHCDLLQIAA